MTPADLTVTKAGAVFWREQLKDGKALIFRAEDIRNQNTGVHAKITIIRGKTRAESDTFNIGRRSERNSLANAAWDRGFNEQLDGEPLISKDEMRYKLMLFLDSVYPALTTVSEPGLVHGNAIDNPVEFLAEPHILSGGGSILFGPGGGGKSHTLLVLSVAIDAGVDTLWTTKQSRVLLVNLERSAGSLERRLEGTNRALGLDPHRPIRMLNARGKSLKDTRDAIDQYVQREGVDLVALDSLTRAGAGDLNDNQTGNSFSDTMNVIAPTWIAVGHVARADPSHLYGSIMYEAAADVLMMFRSEERREDNVLGVRIDMTKANDVPKVNEFVLKYRFDPKTQLLASVETARKEEFPDIAQDVKREGTGVVADVVDFLRHNAEDNQATGTEIADALGKKLPNVNAILNKNHQFFKIGRIPGKGGVFYGLAQS